MQLQLFHKWQCPYSAKVRDFIDAHGLNERIEYAEITEDQGAQDKLAELTGKSQVPCLVVDGTPLLESDAIVKWLQQNLTGA